MSCASLRIPCCARMDRSGAWRGCRWWRSTSVVTAPCMAAAPGQRPALVNISDYGDPIAILRPFKTYFPGVELDLTESVGLFDFHRAARYLACASLAATLQPFVQGK
jgi:hypothetical protein